MIKQLKEITAYDAIIGMRDVLSSLIVNFLIAYGAISLVRNLLEMIIL